MGGMSWSLVMVAAPASSRHIMLEDEHLMLKMLTSESERRCVSIGTSSFCSTASSQPLKQTNKTKHDKYFKESSQPSLLKL